MLGKRDFRKATIFAAVFSAMTMTCANQIAAQEVSEKNIELSLGAQLGLAQGKFADAAEFGIGGHFRAGYWINDRLAIGATVAEVTFLPKDFFSTAYLYSDLEIEWSIFALEADVKYQFLRFSEPTSETTQHSALYVTARTGLYRTRFTITHQEEELLKDSENSEGYAGGIGVRYIVPKRGKWSFVGLSLYAEALYYHIPTTPQETNFLLFKFGLSCHFGPKL